MQDKREHKNNLPVITAELFDLSPERYELRKGTYPGAPLCPYGNHFSWIGFDKIEMRYVRFSKSVFKRMIRKLEHNNLNED